ncbi:cadherin-like beta sandwich domain-containing protein [Acutalibacter muris]|uniref:cadherin-like beta sandwich domain-containing protein n=1 Tax=Acutalibacter muris TaxID=1796620 RepID=UPI00272E7FCE|nr:cadherin-like beta sandwich domain-containing protein [Acutalibacter muris]
MRRIIVLFAALAALWFLPAEGHALGFEVSGSQEGEGLEVQVEYDGTYGRVNACVFRVSFEPGLMDFVGTQEISGGYLVNTIEGSTLRAVYSSYTDGSGLESVSFEFKARKTADITTTRVEVYVEQVAAQKEVPEIPPVSVEYEERPPASSEAKLLALNPDSGELEPEFSPDITEYEMSVPYSVTEMSFGISASPGARVSVNRRNLGSGGSDTLFRLTVTAEDGVTKQVYTVNVHRGEYIAPTPKPTATPKPSPTPKPTAVPKAEKTAEPDATPKATKTPKPTATPKAAKTPKPTASPKAGSTPAAFAASGPGEAGGADSAPLTEVVTIEREGVSTFDRLAALGGVFAAVLGAAAVGTFVYEKLGRRREEQLKGGRRRK